MYIVSWLSVMENFSGSAVLVEVVRHVEGSEHGFLFGSPDGTQSTEVIFPFSSPCISEMLCFTFFFYSCPVCLCLSPCCLPPCGSVFLHCWHVALDQLACQIIPRQHQSADSLARANNQSLWFGARIVFLPQKSTTLKKSPSWPKLLFL